MSDWTGVVVGIATIYFLWQQNHIFRRQNEIFAAQSGGTQMVLPETSPRLRRYWPMLAMAGLALLIWAGVLYGYYDRHKGTRFDSSAHLEVITGREYINEKVPLDGFEYANCKFTNVTFVYDGATSIRFNHNEISGHIEFFTNNEAAFMAIAFLKGTGAVSPDMPLTYGPGRMPANVGPPTKRLQK